MPRRHPQHSRQHQRNVVPWIVAAVAAVAIVTGAVVAWPASGEPTDAAASPSASATETPAPEVSPSAVAPAEPSPTPTAPPTVEFTLVTGGDVLTHGPVLTSALRAGDGEYDFEPLMENVRPFIEGADLAICHLEVPVAPPGVAPSGYPVFGAPEEIVTALKAEGWDGCSTASNHSMDRGDAGLQATLAAFDAASLGHSGMARSETEAARVQTYVVRTGDRTIRVANISYTYGLNGLPKPSGKPWAVNTFNADDADVAPILEAAERAREQGADVVIASTHCCVEYLIEPNRAQRQIVDQIAESGLVDLYVGHHAHVPQPIEFVANDTAAGGMWALFGHGNYLSNQDTQCCRADTNSGYIVTTTFAVDPDGVVTATPEWTGITVDRLDSHTMHVLAEIADAGTGNLSPAEAQARHARVAGAAGDQARERTTPGQSLADGSYANVRWFAPAEEDAAS